MTPLLLAVMSVCSNTVWAQGPEVLWRFDCGPGPAPEGWTPLKASTATRTYALLGTGITDRDRGGDDPVRRDLIFAPDAEFVIGVDNGQYSITLLLGDQDFAHGPYDIYVQGAAVLRDVATNKNEFVEKRLEADVTDNRLSVRIKAEKAPNFALAALTIEGPPQQAEHAVLEPPPKEIPPPEEIDAREIKLEGALRRYCEYLLDTRESDGFLNPASREVYRCGYGLRVLLAASEIFGEQRYLDAATKMLDGFVARQLPNGSWASGWPPKPTAEMSAAEIERIMAGTTNLADVGSAAVCLSVASRSVDAERKARYLSAARRYADEYASKYILPTGAFTNGRWSGKEMTVPYSVATGTQGMSFCALYAATGEEKYLSTAENAVRFLLEHWLEDGRPIHCHHEQDRTYTQQVTSFGDIFYYHEAILWVAHHTRDAVLREQIKQVYRWHIFGEQGLLQARDGGVWWPVGHPWTNSKAAGTPLVYLGYMDLMDWPREAILQPDAAPQEQREVAAAAARGLRMLTTPEYAVRLGVAADPRMPWGHFGVAATGFGGLVLAETLHPGMIYMKPEAR